MTVQEDVTQLGVVQDASFVGRFVRDAANTGDSGLVAVILFCMAPFLSLFVHESFRKLEVTNSALAPILSPEVRSIVERSRHSLKLFEDTHRGIEGQTAYFRDEIVPTHQDYFRKLCWFPPARRFVKDLGIYSYGGRIITSTHGATFHIGIAPEELFSLSGKRIRNIYEQYGQYFHQLGARLDPGDAPTFISDLNPRGLDRPPNDVRSSDYYPSVFNGATTPGLNAVLTVFRGMMNFADSVIGQRRGAEEIEGTVFKIRFLTLYEILESLVRLANEERHILTGRSLSFIDRLSGSAEAGLIRQRTARPFRNTLMHYKLDSKVDASLVDVNKPLFGLPQIYFPSLDLPEFFEVVDRCIHETSAAMEEWALQ